MVTHDPDVARGLAQRPGRNASRPLPDASSGRGRRGRSSRRWPWTWRRAVWRSGIRSRPPPRPAPMRRGRRASAWTSGWARPRDRGSDAGRVAGVELADGRRAGGRARGRRRGAVDAGRHRPERGVAADPAVVGRGRRRHVGAAADARPRGGRDRDRTRARTGPSTRGATGECLQPGHGRWRELPRIDVPRRRNRIRAALVPAILARGAGYVPGIASARVGPHRVCARPQSVDGRPLVGRVPGIDGLWVAAGHGPWGISTGPASGRLLADLLDGRVVSGHRPHSTLTGSRPRRLA